MTQMEASKHERNDLVIARVLDEGASYREAARELGISAERARQIVNAHRTKLRRELDGSDVEERALQLRYRAALELVDELEPAERWALLVAVIWPRGTLLAASHALAASPHAREDHRRTCSACGIGIDDYTEGCRTCTERRIGRRRRARQREQAPTEARA